MNREGKSHAADIFTVQINREEKNSKLSVSSLLIQGLCSNTPINMQLKFLCLKNIAIGWGAEQSGATQSSHINGSLGAKPMSLGDFLIF